MKKTKTIEFMLSKDNKFIGRIKWQYDLTTNGRLVDDSGRISGDEIAVNLMTQTAKKALSEQWVTAFAIPHLLTDPFTFPEHFLTLFVKMDWDIPNELQTYWDNILGHDNNDEMLPNCY